MGSHGPMGTLLGFPWGPTLGAHSIRFEVCEGSKRFQTVIDSLDQTNDHVAEVSTNFPKFVDERTLQIGTTEATVTNPQIRKLRNSQNKLRHDKESKIDKKF